MKVNRVPIIPLEEDLFFCSYCYNEAYDNRILTEYSIIKSIRHIENKYASVEIVFEVVKPNDVID